jgi:hypothetical protein
MALTRKLSRRAQEAAANSDGLRNREPSLAILTLTLQLRSGASLMEAQ